MSKREDFKKIKDSFKGQIGIYEQYIPKKKCKVMIREIEVGDFGVKIYIKWLGSNDDRKRLGSSWSHFIFNENKLEFYIGIMGWRISFCD